MERRDFIKAISGGLMLLYAGSAVNAAPSGRKGSVRFGMMTDSHYADIDTKGTRHYRESIAKTREAIDCFNDANLDFIIELGDIKDMASDKDASKTIKYLKQIEKELQRYKGPVYHVLGNHDMDCISKEEFLGNVRNHGKADGKAYYGFTVKGIRFIVLDANYNEDMSDYCRGNFKWTSAWIPQEQLDWLEAELKANSDKPVVVFVHQMLDSFTDVTPKVFVRNAGQVRERLEKHPQVLAVFQGHHHPGHYSMMNGIHYFTLKGMIEKGWPEHNSYAIVEIRPDGSISLDGYKDCPDMNM